MGKYYVKKPWLLGGISLLSLFCTAPGLGQVVPQGATSIPELNNCAANCTINGGIGPLQNPTAVNLFHSFSDFNVPPGVRVEFTDPGVNHIFARVTGGRFSDIQGELAVSGPAHLFLINPDGVSFGPNATVDISGSFVATTADAIQFEDNGIFSALGNDPIPPALLTINPSAYQFNQVPGAITSQANLTVQGGQRLTLLGGPITLEGGSIRTVGLFPFLANGSQVDLQ